MGLDSTSHARSRHKMSRTKQSRQMLEALESRLLLSGNLPQADYVVSQRYLMTPGGYLTAPRAGTSLDIARSYLTQRFEPGDYLVFGRETRGLPASLLAAHTQQALTIPMAPEARSLNLATAVGIVLYEARRQNPS